MITAFRTRRPVRLELPSDLTHVEITVPEGVLGVGDLPPAGAQVADAARAVATALAESQRPILLFDLPAVRWGALDAIKTLCATGDVPCFCTVPAVHQADSDDARFLGMLPSTNTEIQELYAAADLVIACGLLQSDVTTGCFSLDLDSKRIIRLAPTYTQLGGEGRAESASYYGTSIPDVLAAVVDSVDRPAGRWWSTPAAVRSPPASVGRESSPISEEYFFHQLEGFLRTGDVLVAETGTSAQNTVGMPLPSGVRYVNQSSWGSIGYALPALLGSLVSSPERRHVLCTGDGSFQVTAQELSAVIRHRFAPIMFLLNNRGYTIERSILGANSAYNDVANWSYPDLPRVFGIEEDRFLSRVCTTTADLDAALRDVGDTSSLAFIEVQLEPLDMTANTRFVGEATRVYDYGVYGPANDWTFES